MNDCDYCDRLSGRVEGPPITFETEHVVSFIGRIQPTGPGYSLVVPRRHIVDLHEADMAELSLVIEAVQRVSRAVMAAFNASGTTILLNNGPPGQSVMHLHFHVVPRHPGDGYPKESFGAVGDVELQRQADVLRTFLGSSA